MGMNVASHGQSPDSRWHVRRSGRNLERDPGGGGNDGEWVGVGMRGKADLPIINKERIFYVEPRTPQWISRSGRGGR